MLLREYKKEKQQTTRSAALNLNDVFRVFIDQLVW